MNTEDKRYCPPQDGSYQQVKRRKLDAVQQQLQTAASSSSVRESSREDIAMMNQKLRLQQEQMRSIAQKVRETGPIKKPKKESKRAEAFKKITRADAVPEVETTQKDYQKKNVLKKMESSVSGPLRILYDCMTFSLKAKVWIRRYKGLRGVVTGYIVAFDGHMNLAMMDVDEVYTIESWMIGEPLKKCQKKRLKKQEEKRYIREFQRQQQLGTSHEKATKNTNQLENPKKTVSAESTSEFLKKLTQNIKNQPSIVLSQTEIPEPADCSQTTDGTQSYEQPDLWSILKTINLDLLNTVVGDSKGGQDTSVYNERSMRVQDTQNIKAPLSTDETKRSETIDTLLLPINKASQAINETSKGKISGHLIDVKKTLGKTEGLLENIPDVKIAPVKTVGSRVSHTFADTKTISVKTADPLSCKSASIISENAIPAADTSKHHEEKYSEQKETISKTVNKSSSSNDQRSSLTVVTRHGVNTCGIDPGTVEMLDGRTKVELKAGLNIKSDIADVPNKTPQKPRLKSKEANLIEDTIATTAGPKEAKPKKSKKQKLTVDKIQSILRAVHHGNHAEETVTDNDNTLNDSNVSTMLNVESTKSLSKSHVTSISSAPTASLTTENVSATNQLIAETEADLLEEEVFVASKDGNDIELDDEDDIYGDINMDLEFKMDISTEQPIPPAEPENIKLNRTMPQIEGKIMESATKKVSLLFKEEGELSSSSSGDEFSVTKMVNKQQASILREDLSNKDDKQESSQAVSTQFIEEKNVREKKKLKEKKPKKEKKNKKKRNDSKCKRESNILSISDASADTSSGRTLNVTTTGVDEHSNVTDLSQPEHSSSFVVKSTKVKSDLDSSQKVENNMVKFPNAESDVNESQKLKKDMVTSIKVKSDLDSSQKIKKDVVKSIKVKKDVETSNDILKEDYEGECDRTRCLDDSVNAANTLLLLANSRRSSPSHDQYQDSTILTVHAIKEEMTQIKTTLALRTDKNIRSSNQQLEDVERKNEKLRQVTDINQELQESPEKDLPIKTEECERKNSTGQSTETENDPTAVTELDNPLKTLNEESVIANLDHKMHVDHPMSLLNEHLGRDLNDNTSFAENIEQLRETFDNGDDIRTSNQSSTTMTATTPESNCTSVQDSLVDTVKEEPCLFQLPAEIPSSLVSCVVKEGNVELGGDSTEYYNDDTEEHQHDKQRLPNTSKTDQDATVDSSRKHVDYMKVSKHFNIEGSVSTAKVSKNFNIEGSVSTAKVSKDFNVEGSVSTAKAKEIASSVQASLDEKCEIKDLEEGEVIDSTDGEIKDSEEEEGEIKDDEELTTKKEEEDETTKSKTKKKEKKQKRKKKHKTKEKPHDKKKQRDVERCGREEEHREWQDSDRHRDGDDLKKPGYKGGGQHKHGEKHKEGETHRSNDGRRSTQRCKDRMKPNDRETNERKLRFKREEKERLRDSSRERHSSNDRSDRRSKHFPKESEEDGVAEMKRRDEKFTNKWRDRDTVKEEMRDKLLMIKKKKALDRLGIQQTDNKKDNNSRRMKAMGSSTYSSGHQEKERRHARKHSECEKNKTRDTNFHENETDSKQPLDRSNVVKDTEHSTVSTSDMLLQGITSTRTDKQDDVADVSTLNVFQRRKHKSNVTYSKTYVKRTYGWLQNDEQTDDTNNAKNVSNLKDSEEQWVRDNSNSEIEYQEDKEHSPCLSEAERYDQQRRQWRIEALKRRERETDKQTIEKLLGTTFQPKVPKKGLIYKRRHVNQLFIRGDNIVMVAYDKPENWEQLKAEHERKLKTSI